LPPPIYGFQFHRSKIGDIRRSEDLPELVANLEQEKDPVQASGAWRHRKKSGVIIDVQIRSYPITIAGRNARLVVATGITEQKSAEGAL